MLSPFDSLECALQAQSQIEGLHYKQSKLRARLAYLRRAAEVDARAPAADWSSGSFPWDDAIVKLLKEVFGLTTFRQDS